MSDRYTGGILSGTAPTVTQQSANGVYTLSQELQYQGQGVWPAAAQNPITQSLRFRSSASAYLNRTPASAGNRQIWTWSGWVKRGALGVYSPLFIAGTTNSQQVGSLAFSSAGGVYDKLELNFGIQGTSTEFWLQTTQVFRDPSAWYHIVCAVDTTQATASNRVKFYVNGTQITALGSYGGYSQYPSQNYNTSVNNTVQHLISRDQVNTAGYFDGYLGEVNFIDGVQLTPSSFGTTDVNGIWQPIPYSGAYGTNGFYLPFRINSTSTYIGAFNGSNQYLNFTGNSSLQLSTGNFTIEAWVYGPTQAAYAGITGSSTVTSGWTFRLNNTGNLVLTNGTTTYTSSSTVAINTWAHVAVTRNGTSLYFFINGNLAGTATSSDSIDLTSGTFQIARGFSVDGTSGYFSGSISNLRIVKGTAVYTANFTPSTTPLTAISGTSLLTLQNATIVDNSTNAFTITNNNTVTTSVSTAIFAQPTLTSDYSGNNNGWFANNISLVSGSTYDSMLDSPSNASSTIANYCTFNPVVYNAGSVTYSNGNLLLTMSGNADRFNIGTLCTPTGKFYWELTVSAINQSAGLGIGISKQTQIANGPWVSSGGPNTLFFNTNSGWNVYGTNLGTGALGTFASNDVIGVAMDMVNNIVYIYQNNTLLTSLSGYIDLNTPHTLFVDSYYSGSSVALNCGQQPFTYTPPTGFNRLNTYNLPVPTIPAGNKVMDATVYTATGSTPQTVTNTAGFQPDFVWTKPITSVGENASNDSVRGSSKLLIINSTAAEATDAQYLTSFNSNGFSLGTNNWSGTTVAGWQWQAGQGVTSSNTNGTITSTVSVNPTAGFSIVTYTSTTGTVGHGLGVAPAMIMMKGRNVSDQWTVGHQYLNNGSSAWNYGLPLNTAAGLQTNSGFWNNTAPTSTVFSQGSWDSGYTKVAYCWTPISGFSAFGTYDGNSSSDGPFVYTGFRPKWIMIRERTSVGGDWFIYDSVRNTYNVVNNYLIAEGSDAQATDAAYVLDFVSNGFKLRGAGGGINYSGRSYVYACFAESPFKIARAR